MQATAPGNVAVQDHKYQEREDSTNNGAAGVGFPDAKVDAVELDARKNDETTEFAAPLKVVDVQDHKYADSPSQGLVPAGSPSSSSSSTPSSPLPLHALHAGKVQARKHDQKTEIDTILGGDVDSHRYSDDRYANFSPS